MDPLGGSGATRLTFTGIATGIDTASIVKALMAVERAPLDRLKVRRNQVDAQRGLVRDLNTKLLALRDAARAIDNRTSTGGDFSIDEEFLSFTSSSSDEDIVTASAATGAVATGIPVAVEQLATQGRQFSLQHASTDLVLAAGETATFTLNDTAGTTFTVTAPAGGLTLDGLRDAINSDAGNDGAIVADVVRDGASQFRLTVSAAKTGVENDFAVTGTLSASLDLTLAQTAQDARVQLFSDGINPGISIVDASNDIEDAVSGITLHLHAQSALLTSPPAVYASETIDVEVDEEVVKEGVQAFVDAYNGVMDFIRAQVSVNQATDRAGLLANDTGIRRVQLQLQTQISSAFKFSASPNNPFAPGGAGSIGGSIGAIGIELGTDGRLSIDDEKFSAALTQNPSAVREFLSGNDNASDPLVFDPGLATAFVDLLEPLVRSEDGLLAERDKLFQVRLDGFDVSIERFETRLVQREETLRARFTRMESLVASLNAQSSFLTSLG